MFSVFNRSRSPISSSAPRVEKSSFAADDFCILRAAGRGTKMSGPSSSTSRKCTGRKVASSTPYSSRAPSPPRRKKVRPRLIRQRLATGEPHLKSPQIGVACDLSCVGERAGCCGRWRAVLHLAVGQIAKSTALSYTCTTSTRCQHTHAHQPLATRGVRKPYRTTAGLA